MPNRKSIKRGIKSEQLMFRASKPLASAIRKAAANQRRPVADWLRQTVEAALAAAPPASKQPGGKPTWGDEVRRLTAEGWLLPGTQRKTPRLLEPPPGVEPSGVLDALLEERREGR